MHAYNYDIHVMIDHPVPNSDTARHWTRPVPDIAVEKATAARGRR